MMMHGEEQKKIVGISFTAAASNVYISATARYLYELQ